MNCLFCNKLINDLYCCLDQHKYSYWDNQLCMVRFSYNNNLIMAKSYFDYSESDRYLDVKINSERVYFVEKFDLNNFTIKYICNIIDNLIFV